VTITTGRLRLRRPRASDEAAMVALDSDPEVMRFVGSPAGPRPAEETLARARQRIAGEHGALGWWVVEARDDGAFCGLGLLLPMPDGDDLELGYRLVRRAWGQGIATEAAGALVDYALGQLDLARLVAVVYPDNAASRRVLEKLGFTCEGPSEYKGAHVLRYVLAAPAWRARIAR
jgi:RimJ/RimL family protein N-acetyltransferase